MNKFLVLCIFATLAVSSSCRLMNDESYDKPPADIDFQKILQVVLQYAAGVGYGFTEIVDANNASLCLNNVNNITALVEEIIHYDWSGSFWDKARQFLTLGVKALNITIDEWLYCYDVYTIGYRFYYVFRYIYTYFYYFLRDMAYNILHYSFFYVYQIKQLYNALEAEDKFATGDAIARIAFRVLLNYTYWNYETALL